MQLRTWGLRALGGPIFIFLPRVAPGLLALAGAYSCFRLPPSRAELSRLLLWTAFVAAYPILSTVWALDTRRALTVVGTAALIALVSALVFRRAGRLRDVFWPAVAYGVPLMVFISLLDIVSGLPIRTFFAEMGVAWVGQPATVGKTGQVTPDAVNWSMAIMALSLFPYLSVTREASKGSFGKQALRITVAVAIALAALMSTHQSSMVAICAGLLAYGIASASKKSALLLVMAGWLTSIAATPLIMSAALPWADKMGGLVPGSLQHRFVIWRVALTDVAASPWIGSGAGSTRITFRKLEMNKKRTTWTGLAAHSHNWFLDLWRELGAIGAALAVVFASVISHRLLSRLQDVAHEQIAFLGLVLAMSTASFGLWTAWYLSAIGLSFAMFGMTKIGLLGEPQDIAR
jgi:O-antigen ligase